MSEMQCLDPLPAWALRVARRNDQMPPVWIKTHSEVPTVESLREGALEAGRRAVLRQLREMGSEQP